MGFFSKRVVECVPNFSEGRDARKVKAIEDAIRSVDGIAFLDREMDGDHNRSVLTFAGEPDAVAEAALRAVGCAVEVIDLNRHSGVHPRIGAADVVPFVPVAGVSIEDCVRIAECVGKEIWKRYGVPVYFYEAAARTAERKNLENIRRGQFERLREEIGDRARRPDIGEPRVHPTAGATVVGARKFLIAYNINLNTADVAVAKKIARAVRASSGGLPYVKALGVPLASRNLAQVTMNLTDFEQTPMHRVYEAVRAEAERYGVSIAGSEIIGLLPRRAVEMTAEFYLRFENFRPDVVLETRMEQAAGPADSGAITPTSAAARAGAMAAALAASAAAAAGLRRHDFSADRRFFATAATAAEIAGRAAELAGRLEAIRSNAPPAFEPDIAAAVALAEAAQRVAGIQALKSE